MRRIQRILCLCASALLVNAYVSAQAQSAKASDPAKTALIEELIVALRAEQNQQQVMQTVQNSMLNQITQAMETQMKNFPGGSQADADKKRSMQADVQELQRRIFTLMTERMSWPVMKPVYIAMYDDTFTADELRPLVVFFKSPAGQAYVNKTPALLGNTMKRMQQVVGEMMPDIQKLNAEFMQQMKEKYSGKP